MQCYVIVKLPVGRARGLIWYEHQLTPLSSVTLLIDFFLKSEEETDVKIMPWKAAL